MWKNPPKSSIIPSGHGGAAPIVIDLKRQQAGATPPRFHISNSDPATSAIRDLSMNISGLREDIKTLTAVMQQILPPSSEIEIREISEGEAYAEISQLLKERGDRLFPSDIHEILGIEYKMVIKTLEQLSQQGKIEYPSR